MSLKRWEIHDIDGNVLHSGMSKSKRGFVEWLVWDSQSLDRADLHGLDLSRLDLQGMRARGACLDGVDLSGAQIQEADFTGSTFRPFKAPNGVTYTAHFDGCNAIKTIFDRCDLTEARFTGGRLTYMHARHAVLDRTSFASASLTGCCLAHARGSETDFSSSTMKNAEMPYAVFSEPDFTGTDLRHEVFSAVDEEVREHLTAHLPNRTEGATILSGRYSRQTQFSQTVPAIRHDAMVSRNLRRLTATASMLALVGVLHCSEPMTEVVSHFLGVQGASEIGLVGAVALMQTANHTVGDWLRERTDDVLGGIVERIRKIVHECENRGARRADLVCAMARGSSIAPLRLALDAKIPEARRRGFWHHVKGFIGELGHVIVCDRRHLALALGTLSLHAENGITLEHDITLVRHPGKTAGAGQDAPVAVRFLRDGRASSVWTLPDGRRVTIRYDARGGLEGCWNSQGIKVEPSDLPLPKSAYDRLEANLALERAMLADHGLGDFRYPRETHQLRNGRDGSILVQGRADRLISNPVKSDKRPSRHYPAIIRPDGRMVSIFRGRIVPGTQDENCGSDAAMPGLPQATGAAAAAPAPAPAI